MRLHLICPKCTDFTNPRSAMKTFVRVQLEESGLYTLLCPAGHTTEFYLQQMKFELLFDLGLHAVIDGYYREAVSAFSSCFERFSEFYIELQCYRLGIDEQVYRDAWRHVANQSERQLGAFVFMHLTETKRAPQLLPQKATTFRNAVIHKGRFPDESEAIDFGRQVFAIIRPTLSRLLSEQAADVQQMVFRHLKRIPKTSDDNCCVSIPTLLSMSRKDAHGFDDWMAILEAERRSPFSNAPIVRKPQP